MTRRAPIILLGVLTAALLAACADESADESTDDPPGVEMPAEESTDDPEGSPAVVEIERSRFQVAEIEVGVGDTVRWTNLDRAAHSVTADDGSPADFDSGDLGEDQTFEVTFDAAGEYRYFCGIHPTMRATVIVS